MAAAQWHHSCRCEGEAHVCTRRNGAVPVEGVVQRLSMVHSY